MRDFLKLISKSNNLFDIVSNYSLFDLYNLRNDKTFGTQLYKFDDLDLRNLSKDLYDFYDFLYKLNLGNNDMSIRMSQEVVSAYFHRTLCGVKALSLWNNYKKCYLIDKDWYADFIKTEDIYIDFSLLNKLPFDSFYIDMSNLNLMRTKHYQDVIGVIVNVIDIDNIHVTIIDNNNPQYNPIKCWGDDIRNYMYAYLYDDDDPIIISKTEKLYENGQLMTNIRYEPIADDVIFPKNWYGYDVGNVHFIDFILNRNKAQTNILSCSAASCFGWCVQYGGVIENNDLLSPAVTEIMRFVIQFLYFLHSKTNDIIYNKSINTSKISFNKTNNNIIEQWNVGVRYGEKIRTLNKKYELYGSHVLDNNDRNRPKAYVRCAHWHNYWHGSNDNKHLELHWLEPIYCNGFISDIITVVNEVSDADRSQTAGEYNIQLYLDKVGVEYTKEKYVFIDGHNRRFDFEIKFDNKIMFIEFDGEQHFGYSEYYDKGDINKYKSRKLADFSKNKYAKKNRIPLLRIRYDQMLQIPDLIDAFLLKPVVGRLNPVMDNHKYYNNF